jgi:hypothetical protein
LWWGWERELTDAGDDEDEHKGVEDRYDGLGASDQRVREIYSDI